jgi:hypothetical protein
MNNAIHKPREHVKAIPKKREPPQKSLTINPHMHTSSNNTQHLPHQNQTHTQQSTLTYPYHQSTNNPYKLCLTTPANAITTKLPALLVNTLHQYIEHQPSTLGLMEMQQNWKLSDQTTIPLQNMATSPQGNKKA